MKCSNSTQNIKFVNQSVVNTAKAGWVSCNETYTSFPYKTCCNWNLNHLLILHIY